MRTANKRFHPLLALGAALLLCTCPLDVAAQSPAGEFSVRAVIPDNQVDKNQTYFDLRLSPGETQTVQIVAENSSSEAITVETTLNPASTSDSGLISYTQQNPEGLDPPVSIEDAARVVDSAVELAPGQEARINIDITMPPAEFDGAILGGITVTAAKSEAAEAGEGLSLQSELLYVIGLKITQNDNPVSPDFILEDIVPGTVNYRTAVCIMLKNPRALIVKGMTAQAEIYQKDRDEIFRRLEVNYGEMAPNSTAPLVVDWENSPLVAGDYRLKLRVEYEDQVWEWDEYFQIQAEEATSANSGAVVLNTRNRIWRNLLWALLAIAAIALIFFLLGKRSRERKAEK